MIVSSQPSFQRPRVVIADAEGGAGTWLAPTLTRRLSIDVELVLDGAGLERCLNENDAHLVITNANLLGATGLQILAKFRSRGTQTPFIVFTAIQGNFMRVFISDGEGTVLSSRIIAADSLCDLARSLMRRGPIRANVAAAVSAAL